MLSPARETLHQILRQVTWLLIWSQYFLTLTWTAFFPTFGFILLPYMAWEFTTAFGIPCPIAARLAMFGVARPSMLWFVCYLPLQDKSLGWAEKEKSCLISCHCYGSQWFFVCFVESFVKFWFAAVYVGQMKRLLLMVMRNGKIETRYFLSLFIFCLERNYLYESFLQYITYRGNISG